MITKFKGDYAWLSNFYPSEIEWATFIWPTVEHAFQAGKVEWDERVYLMVRSLPSPSLAKKWGRTVNLIEDWESIKLDHMEGLLDLKFAIPELRKKLLATGDERLVEGNNWHDIFWGVCDGACNKGPHQAHGFNNLGLLLMKIRDELKGESNE